MTYMRGRSSVWVLTGIILVAQGLFSRPAFTQGEPQLRGPELLQEIRHDISPPLRDIKLLLGPVQGNTLWSGFGGPCQTNNDGDIVVLFDKLNNRWVMSQLSVTGGPPFYQCVAVSSTSDATGSFARYAFQQPNFNDYPKLGVWPDAYYVSYNLFDFITGSFQGARLCAMNAAAMRAGTTATQQCFQLSTS